MGRKEPLQSSAFPKTPSPENTNKELTALEQLFHRRIKVLHINLIPT